MVLSDNKAIQITKPQPQSDPQNNSEMISHYDLTIYPIPEPIWQHWRIIDQKNQNGSIVEIPICICIAEIYQYGTQYDSIA